jgi:steroid delta-isomerase-like uncharacterized protein
MSTEDHKATTRRFFEEIFNEGNMAVVDEIKSATYVFHDPSFPEAIRGPEGFKRYLMMFRTAFPDLHSTLEVLIAEGEQVTVRFTFTGTQQGAIMGIPPTGKPVKVTAILICRFVDGKIVEGWINYDTLGMLQQLGAIPPPGQAS